MQLSLFCDYSLRMLLYLGARPEEGGTIREIALAYGISKNHLMKVSHELVRHGYLAAKRGRAGGLRLARPAAEINAGEVVRLFESRVPLVECFPGGNGGCLLTPACRLKGALAQAQAAFYDSLSAYTLADLLNKKTVALLAGAP